MNIACFLFGHKTKEYRKVVDGQMTEVICERCKSKFIFFKAAKITLPLTEEARRTHDKIILTQYFAGD